MKMQNLGRLFGHLVSLSYEIVKTKGINFEEQQTLYPPIRIVFLIRLAS